MDKRPSIICNCGGANSAPEELCSGGCNSSDQRTAKMEGQQDENCNKFMREKEGRGVAGWSGTPHLLFAQEG
jgi:hypothetical protein